MIYIVNWYIRSGLNDKLCSIQVKFTKLIDSWYFAFEDVSWKNYLKCTERNCDENIKTWDVYCIIQ